MDKNLHLDYIDFIKGLAALSVILLHTLPERVLYDTFAVYHIWQAVPTFLFITFYLGFRNLYKKQTILKDYYSVDRIKKVFTKLWLPLLILAVIQAVFYVVIGNNHKAIGALCCFSNGPGSYYIWCYMQVWLLIPFIYYLFKRFNILTGGVILLIISVICDVVYEEYIGTIPGFTCFRYLFLSVPAYMYLKDVKVKEVTFFITLSIIYLFLMHYSDVPMYIDPALPNGWEAQTSLGFFYTYFLFVALSKCYNKLRTYKVTKYISYVGTISWEVFLVQMILLGSGIVDYVCVKFFHSVYLQVSFKVIITLLISLILAELYKKVLNVIVHYIK